MWILGLAGSHNSGAALIKDGKVVVAVQTERLVRAKRQSITLDRLGTHAGEVIRYCLHYAGIDLPDVDAIATCTPWEAIHPRFSAYGLSSSPAASVPRFVTVPHHLAHAEYALHYSPMEPSLVLVCDGSGTFECQRAQLDIQEQEWKPLKYIREGGKESISAYVFDGANLKLTYRVAYGPVDDLYSDPDDPRRPRWLASLGHLWEWAAEYCHGSFFEAGKVMGLAPFGDPNVHATLNTVSIDGRGEVQINLHELFRRYRSGNVSAIDVTGNKHYADIAAHVQHSTNEFLVALVQFLRTLYDTPHVCYSGGVALNSVANEQIRSRLGIELHMNGSCEDNGTAIGAALAVYHSLTGLRVPEHVTDYYGREYSSAEIEHSLSGYSGQVVQMSRAGLLRHTAAALESGSIVGWFQGRSEFGPRALGNRSILADPRNEHMQEILNRRVKNREAFRPYAPAVVEERASDFFEIDGPSPVMLRVVNVRSRSLPAITHVDGTARVQTVNRGQNERLYDLLTAFGAQTGFPVLLNTSFNTSGEPIVETPSDALRTFAASDIDVLVLGDHVVHARVERSVRGEMR
jgi:carbamoyltransferase